jgi:hypothetical protein
MKGSVKFAALVVLAVLAVVAAAVPAGLASGGETKIPLENDPNYVRALENVPSGGSSKAPETPPPALVGEEEEAAEAAGEEGADDVPQIAPLSAEEAAQLPQAPAEEQ